jgi:glutamate synthase (NADPH/NADH) small chain
MGNPKAFMTIPRQEAGYRAIHERIKDFSEVEQTLNSSDRRLQASRCMDCGVPFCHWACPLGNKQPEWQDYLHKGRWNEAYNVLIQTCDFPEFTGRICPALCEKSCVLNLSIHEPVTIRENEVAIIEAAFHEGYVKTKQPVRNGKRVAVIGSGPAGLTVANRMNHKGYAVTVYEKDELPGGLLRYGIPNFKLGKQIIDRRTNLMKEEGVEFKTGQYVGREIKAADLVRDYDAVCIAIGSEVPRNINVEGRDLKGVHFALEYLGQQNRILEGSEIADEARITAKGKNVLVIGGGDTGSDCVGTAKRQGAKSITQIEILPQPPADFNPATPWPQWPQILKTSSSHEEGCTRRWNITTNRFVGDASGTVKQVEIEEVEWKTATEGSRPEMALTGRKETLDAELVFLCMGFVNPIQDSIIGELSLDIDGRKNIAVDDACRTSAAKVFACGDAVSGASLVVRAMAAGIKTATAIDNFLTSTF